MRLGEGRVSGICLCGFHGYAPSRSFVVFTPYPVWQGIGFMVSFTPYVSTHMGSLCIAEFQVPWITEDMGVFWSAGDWFCQQYLFPWSSFSFGSVWLVRRRYISPDLSLARE